MQNVSKPPSKVDGMGLPQDLCFPGEEPLRKFDLSGLPFFLPSSGQEPPGASGRPKYDLNPRQDGPLANIVADPGIRALDHLTINILRPPKLL